MVSITLRESRRKNITRKQTKNITRKQTNFYRHERTIILLKKKRKGTRITVLLTEVSVLSSTFTHKNDYTGKNSGGDLELD